MTEEQSVSGEGREGRSSPMGCMSHMGCVCLRLVLSFAPEVYGFWMIEVAFMSFIIIDIMDLLL